MNIYAQILIDEAKRRGIQVKEVDNDFNIFYLTYNGETVRCWESLTDKTTAFTLSICQNKFLTGKYLKEAGLNVAKQAIWDGEAQGLNFFQQCRDKVVVKPLNGEQGKGITVGVNSKKKLLLAVEEAKKYDDNVLIEEHVEGKDLRVIVIDYKFVAAIERIPATVIGDGAKSIKELIEEKNKILHIETVGESQIPVNQETIDFIEEQEFLYDDIPQAGELVGVCRLCNFHSGGTIRDVTLDVSEKLIEISEKASRALQIPVVGLDFLLPELSGNSYVIIEANERPGLANHEPQPTAERFIDFLFPQTR